MFFFPFVEKEKAWQRDLLWFWSVQDVFYESLLSRNVQRSSLCVRNTKEDTVRRSCDALAHNKDFSVLLACSLLLNQIDSAYSERQSVQTDEVCLSRDNEATCDYTAEPGQALWDPKQDSARELQLTFQCADVHGNSYSCS